MKIRMKLLVGFMSMIIITVILGVTALVMVTAIQGNLTKITDTILVSEELIGVIEFNSDYMVHMMHHYTEGTGIDDGSTRTKYEASKTNVLNSITELSILLADDSELSEKIVHVDSGFEEMYEPLDTTDTGYWDLKAGYIAQSDKVHLEYPALMDAFITFAEAETNATAAITIQEARFHFEHAIHKMHHFLEGTLIGTRASYNVETSSALELIDIVIATTEQGTGVTQATAIKNGIISINTDINATSTGLFDLYDAAADEKDEVHIYFPLLLIELNDMKDSFAVETKSATKAADDSIAITMALTISLVALSLILGVGITITITRSIVNPLNEVDTRLDAISKGGGDLTQRIQLDSNDELGSVARSFNAFMEFQQELVQGVREVAERLMTSSEELAASSGEINASSEEISSVIQQMNSGAQQQAEMINTSVTSVQTLADVAEKIINDITGTVGVISDVAVQTNMLALNAAIEAARAGDYGKGFAVVADNVRRLAEDTKLNTGNIKDLVMTIQQEITSNIDLIAKSIETVAAVAEETAASSEEASAATEEQTATMEEMSAASQELAQLAEELTSSMGMFKVDDQAVKELDVSKDQTKPIPLKTLVGKVTDKIKGIEDSKQ